MEVLETTTGAGQRRQHDFRPAAPPRPPPEVRGNWIVAMRERKADPGQSDRCRLRQQTVETVFGIVKQAMGFRQFLLRGIDMVQDEWNLAVLAISLNGH